MNDILTRKLFPKDLSSNTASALDLTLTYYLAKAHLGSLALEPEYHANAAVARATSKEFRLIQFQTQIINTAKNNAISALQLAISRTGFRDRLIYLPSFYHFLLVHSAGFLLLLLQRKSRFILAGEAKGEYLRVQFYPN
jgi:Ni/Fe-hydrogenase subunit HybB-like protein